MGLTESLDALVVEHDRIGSPLRSRLGPGVPSGKVEAALAEVGLTPSDELVELFAWHEVCDEPDDRQRIEWFWPAAPLRLDEAVDSYRSMCAIGDGAVTMAQFDELVRAPKDPWSSFTGFWRQDWLPILYGHEEYAAECGLGGERRATSAVWRVMWHPADDFPTMQLASSLTAFVERVVVHYRLGGYRWNEQYQAIETIDEVFEREGLGHNVRPWPSLPAERSG